MSHEYYKHIGTPLSKAVEECAEVIKIACKIDRFGWFNYHPDDPNKTTNIDLLRREMDDVIEAFNVLEQHIKQIIALHLKNSEKRHPEAGYARISEI